MLNELTELLSRNEISLENFEVATYQNLKLSIFEVVCRLLKDKKIKSEVKSKLRNSRNKLLFMKEFILDTCGCKLSDDESEEILEWLNAYFRKRDVRVRYPSKLRETLLVEQKNECNICNTHITLSNSELDHIIPWVYVGDELSNNLQLLCSDCNKRKGKSIHFNLNMFLIRKR
jgi:hypothetical protein